MRKYLLTIVWSLAMISSLSLRAQQLISHKAIASNIANHLTTIDNKYTNGNPNLILMVTQKNGTKNNNEVGVWYNTSTKKWTIYNQNRQALPANAEFNVLVINPNNFKKAFVHTTSAANTQGHITTLNNGLTNGKANAMVLVTQRYGKYNKVPVGVWYNNNQWKIYNEDRSPMPIGTQFNVLVLEAGQVTDLGNVTAQTFQHKVTVPKVVTATRTTPNVVIRDHRTITPTRTVASFVGTTIQNAATDKKANASLFITQRYTSAYNTSVTAVNYKEPNWRIANLSGKAMANNVTFNVLVMVPNVVIMDPKLIATTKVAKYPTWNKTVVNNIKLNPSQLAILPYRPTKPAGGADKPEETNEVSTEIEGPNMSIGKDLSSLIDDSGYELFLDKLNLFREVYEDQNPNSGYFYYLPASYNMKWSPETGEYAFYLHYLSSDGGGRGDVLITAELSPNIQKEDIQLAEALLSKELKKEIKLRPMPLSNTPEVTLGNALVLFDVAPNSLNTNIPTDFLQPIVVSWRMGERVDDFVGAMLKNTGVVGNVTFHPYSEIDRDISVTSRLKVNDERTYGVMEYSNAAEVLNGLKNTTDYNIILKRFVVLREKSDKTLAIDEVPLGNYEVEPGKFFASFTDAESNALISGNVIKKLWLDYALVGPCQTCEETIKGKILGGTASNLVNPIEIEVLTPLEAAEASSMKVLIKSKQGDPKGQNEVILPIVTITEDNQTLSGGELFIGEGVKPDFEYQLVLILPDGDVRSSEWIKSEELFVVLGAATIQKYFPEEERP